MESRFFAQGPDQDTVTTLLKHIPPQVIVAHGRNQHDAAPRGTYSKALHYSTPVILWLVAITQDQLKMALRR
jgi:hypothetical protein